MILEEVKIQASIEGLCSLKYLFMLLHLAAYRSNYIDQCAWPCTAHSHAKCSPTHFLGFVTLGQAHIIHQRKELQIIFRFVTFVTRLVMKVSALSLHASDNHWRVNKPLAYHVMLNSYHDKNATALSRYIGQWPLWGRLQWTNFAHLCLFATGISTFSAFNGRSYFTTSS